MPESIQWEILVVDNNSNDQTRDVVEGFCRGFPGRFRYVFEPRPGKSYALNTGIREAGGEILAFLDDDVTVESAWLQSLTEPLKDGEWAGTGGRTLFAQKFTPPPWLGLKEPYNLGGILAAQFDYGDTPHQLTRAPYGANMAFRKEMFKKYGGFRTDLGPSPNREVPRPNEDTELGRRFMAAGERIRYEPKAIVYHPVPDGRIRKDYFLSWYFDYGRANVREWPKGRDILGIRRRFLTILKIGGVVLPTRTLMWVLAPGARLRFFRKCWVWMTCGEVVELYRELQSEGKDRAQNNESSTERSGLAKS